MRPGARLFFALRPPPPVRRELARAGRQFLRSGGGRAVSPARLHLTLSYIGVVDPSRLSALLLAPRLVQAAPFPLCLDTLGAFARVHVGWAGSLEPPPALLDLQARLGQALAEAGFHERERRDFAPHVTLARDLSVGARPPPLGCEPLCWGVRRFSLLAAEPGQARYAWLGSWPLAGKAR